MTNIVILVHNRPRLTRQTLETLVKNTTAPFNCIVVDDASDPETRDVINEFVRPNIRCVRYETPVGIVGALRNAGANSSEWTFGRGEWLYFSDNDVAFEPGWLKKMIEVASWNGGAQVLGGYRHPFHGVNQSIAKLSEGGFFSAGDVMPMSSSDIQLTDAVAGYSMLMRWSTWDKYGGFPANQIGISASEDWSFCRKIVDDGGKVGYIHPPVLYHCGLTNSDGKPAVGSEHFRRNPDIIME